MEVEKDNAATEALLIEANKYKLLGQYNAALELFHDFVLKYPGSSTGNYQLALLHFELGEYTEAYLTSKKAYHLSPSNKYIALFHIDCCLQTQQTDEAFNVYNQLIVKFPADYDLHINFARLQHEAGKFTESLALLRRYTVNNGNKLSTELLSLKNQNFYHLKWTDSIEVTLGELIKLNPANMQYKGLLAELYVSVGKYAQADTVYSALLAQHPTNAQILLSIANYKRIAGKDQEMLALFYRALCDKSLSYKPFFDLYAYFKRQQAKNDCSLCSVMLDSLYHRFPDEKLILEEKYLLAFQENNQKDKIFYLQRLIDAAPNDFQFWQNLLDIYFVNNDFEELYKAANSALEFFPNQAILYYYGGISALRSDRPAEAVSMLKSAEMYEIALENLNLRFQIYYALLEANHFTESYAEADFYFDKAILLEPDNLSLMNNYAFMLSQRQSKLELALSFIDKCLYYQPDYYVFIDTKACVFEAMRDLDAALKLTKLALLKGGNTDAAVLEHHADLLLKLNKNEEALEFYEKAYKLRPSDELLLKIQNEK
jgi:predicted Zn-dependent protease